MFSNFTYGGLILKYSNSTYKNHHNCTKPFIAAKLILCLGLLIGWTLPTQAQTGWKKHGEKVNGTLGNENAGKAVAMSVDGSTVAIGSPDYDENGVNRGRVKIYGWNKATSDWVQKGETIAGTARGDKAGKTLALSGDGSRIIIGAPENDSKGEDSGQAKVYEWDATTSQWKRMGLAIDGVRFGEQAGYSVDISANGSIIAVCAKLHNGRRGSNNGNTRIFEWDSAQMTWKQRGEGIDGEAASDGVSDYAMALSGDGSRIVIGVSANDGNGANSGHTRIFEWNRTAWVQMGEDIDGEARNDYSGYAVDLSADGLTVAIGAPRNDNNGYSSGQTRIFSWNALAHTWVQMGGSIDGEAARDEAGSSVALSADGLTVAIGAPENDGNGKDSGQVRVYEWSNTAFMWIQIADDINGGAAGDYLGNSVGITSNGAIVVTGVPFSDNSEANNGAFIAYKLVNNALPMELLAFNAIRISRQTVELSWLVNNEENCRGFAIEAGSNGRDFETVGFVKGGQKSKRYSYRVLSGAAAYYRVRQADFDGSAYHSALQFVEAGTIAPYLNMFPNPGKGKVTLQLNNAAEQDNLKLVVYNLQTTVLLNVQGNLAEINQLLNQQLSQWTNGVYLVRLVSSTQVMEQRLVLAK